VADASPQLHDGGRACGRCYELQCVGAHVPDARSPGGFAARCGSACGAASASVSVRVTDSCPCAYPPNEASNRRWCCGDVPHFDLSAWAFDKLASSRAAGVLGVRFRRVPCAPAGNVTLRVAAAKHGDKAELVFKVRAARTRHNAQRVTLAARAI
jgi:hypothetical protein